MTYTQYVDPIEADVIDNDDDDTLGPCGCTDYHMSDCPTVTYRYFGEVGEDDWSQDRDYYDD